ncbi:MAG TPA: hypothetical protein VH257_16085, partial [Chloroflexota bacterium]|nr:hypothetical protein [Chloroflexota bacterium]
EHRPDVRSVAAPVFTYTDEAAGAICARHFTPPAEPPPSALIRDVLDAAERISHTLGHGAVLE